MGVVSVTLIPDSSQSESELSQRGSMVRYTRSWRVVTDSGLTNEATVLAACARVGAWHPSDFRATLKKMVVRRENKSKFHWIATATYTTEWWGQSGQENPLAEPAKISWKTAKVQRPIHFDKDGKAILNTAGDFFVPPLMVEISFWVISIKKNLEGVPTWFDGYRDAVNSDTFRIQGKSFEAGTCKIDAIEISEVQERNDVQYVVLSLQIQTSDTFTIYLLNQGYNELNGDYKQPIYLADGTRPQHPQLLDAQGAAILEPTPEDALEVEVEWEQRKTFSVIPVT
jgi:hypothetical protein